MGRPYVVFSGGGTGGHLAPGLNVARDLVRRLPEVRIRFLVLGREVERRFLEPTPFETRKVVSARAPTSKLQLPMTALKLSVGTMQCMVDYLRARPDVVVGLGGYGSIPGMLAARLLGVPTTQIEVNRTPGMAVRKLAARCRVTWTVFDEAAARLNGPTETVGFPLPADYAEVDRPRARRTFGLEPDRLTVVAIGGSQGAAALNRLMSEMAVRLAARGVQVLHQAGPDQVESVRRAFVEARLAGQARAFIDDMQSAWSAADVVVCRAGAATVAELSAVGRAAVFVPFAGAAESHQLKNVEALAVAGRAEMVLEKDADRKLPIVLEELLDDPDRRDAMAAALKQGAASEATERIVDTLIDLLKRQPTCCRKECRRL